MTCSHLKSTLLPSNVTNLLFQGSLRQPSTALHSSAGLKADGGHFRQITFGEFPLSSFWGGMVRTKHREHLLVETVVFIVFIFIKGRVRWKWWCLWWILCPMQAISCLLGLSGGEGERRHKYVMYWLSGLKWNCPFSASFDLVSISDHLATKAWVPSLSQSIKDMTVALCHTH